MTISTTTIKNSLLTVIFLGAAFVYGQTEPPKNSPKVPSTPIPWEATVLYTVVR